MGKAGRPNQVYVAVDKYLADRAEAEREGTRPVTLRDTFAADNAVTGSRGPFDAGVSPELPPLPGMMYDFMFYLLLHPGVTTTDLSREFGVSRDVAQRWRSDPRVLAHIAQMRAEVRSINLAQVSLLERTAREKALEILSMRPTSVTVEEQGKLIRFILDMTAKMRGLQDGPLVSVNVGGAPDVGIYYRPDQGVVDQVIDLAEELRARKRLTDKLKLEAEDVGPGTE